MFGPSLASLVTLAAMAFAAVGVLWWALRGWRQPLPPSCRACLYDVSGRSADSTRCSECGADLSAAGAIVTAVRRRRWIWAGVACVIMVAAGDVGIEGAARLPWRAWFVRAAPAWVIHRQARNDLWPGGDVYRAEWYRREGASPALVDHLLDMQGNVSGPFAQSWDEVLADEFFKGRAMTTSQRQRYVRQMFVGPVRLSVTGSVRVGDPILVMANFATRGCFNGLCHVQFQLAARAEGAANLDASTERREAFDGIDVGTAVGYPEWSGGLRVRSGPHPVSLALRWWIVDHNGQPLTPPAAVTGSQTVVALPRIAHVNY